MYLCNCAGATEKSIVSRCKWAINNGYKLAWVLFRTMPRGRCCCKCVPRIKEIFDEENEKATKPPE